MRCKSAREYGIGSLLAIYQPDSQAPRREITSFDAIHSFDEIMPIGEIFDGVKVITKFCRVDACVAGSVISLPEHAGILLTVIVKIVVALTVILPPILQ